jgi:hypothetical protein
LQALPSRFSCVLKYCFTTSSLLLYYCFTAALLCVDRSAGGGFRKRFQVAPAGRLVRSFTTALLLQALLEFCCTTALLLLSYRFTTALLLQALPSRSGREVGSFCLLNGPHITMCPLTTRCPHTTICVLIPLYMCPLTTVCVLILLYVSSCCDICVRWFAMTLYDSCMLYYCLTTALLILY